jgi:hypothetical protein
MNQAKMECPKCHVQGRCQMLSRWRALTAAIADADRAAAKRAFEAMMQMGKIDIAAIEADRCG